MTPRVLRLAALLLGPASCVPSERQQPPGGGVAPSIPQLGGLVSLSRREAVDAACCEDHEQAVWNAVSFVVPTLRINQDAEGILVEEVFLDQDVDRGVTAVIRSDRGTFGGAGLESVSVVTGDVVAVDRGGPGGGLFAGSADGSVRELSTGARFRSLIATRPDRFYVVSGLGYRGFSVSCWSWDGIAWSSKDLLSDLYFPVLGSDALGEVVVADGLGVFHEATCNGATSLVFEGTWSDDFATVGAAKDEFQCLVPAGDPHSVRRYADGTLAMTTNHNLVLLRPRDDGTRSEEWYGRNSRCNGI